MPDLERRRRRLRHNSTDGSVTKRVPGTADRDGRPPEPASGLPTRTATVHDSAPEPTGPQRQPVTARSAAEDRDGERGLRGLVGSGSSQVSPGAALRARDAARPTETYLAEAEQRVVVVRRHWVPREDLPRGERR